MKRILLVIAFALVVFGGILAIAPGFVDWTKYKKEIVAQLHDSTGFDFAIDGDLQMAILPFPHVLVGNLKMINPQHAEQPLLTLERAEVSVALVPLFSGKVDVSSVTLIKPNIRLSVAADGAQSWMTPLLQEKMKAGGGGKNGGMAESVALNEIKIEDGALEYADLRSGRKYNLQNVNIALSGDTLFGPYDAHGNLTYGGQNVGFTAKSGRIESDADSVALQADIDAPESGTKVEFSGVMAINGNIELQGETSIDSARPAGLAKFAGGVELPAWADKKLSARGILTASAASVGYKNLKLSWNGIEANGSLDATLPQEGSKFQASIVLDAADTIDMAKIMPPPAKKEKGEAKENAARFILGSVTLPMDMGASLVLTAPGLVYNGVTFGNFKLKASTPDGKNTEGSITAALPDKGTFDTSFSLDFGSASRSEKTGALTLSDPVLSYDVALKSPDPAKAIVPLIPATQPWLTGAIALDAGGKITPAAASLDKGSLTLHGTMFGLSGSSYALKKKDGRDLLTAAVTAEKADLDAFLPPDDSKKPAANNEAAVRALVEKIALPFDLDLTLALKKVKLKGTNYDALNVVARLTGKKLDLKTLDLQDSTGNKLTVAGTAGDIGALRDLDMSAQGSTPDLKALLKGFNVQTDKLPQSLKAVELVSEFKGQADRLDFTANLKGMGGSAEASGQLTGVLDKPSVGGLTLRVRHPNYVEMVRLVNPGFSSSVAIDKNFDLFASMTRKDKLYTFDQVQAAIGPASIAGSVKADLSGTKPSIVADMQAGDLPLDKILGHDAGHQGTVRVTPQRAGDNAHWSRDPIDTNWMHNFNFDLKASLKSLSYGPWFFSNAQVEVALKDGVLDIKDVDGQMAGGKAALSGKVVSAAPGEAISADGKVILDGVSLESFVSSFSGSRLVRARGAISLDTSVKATGASPAALIFDLSGQGKASGKNLLFDGFDLAGLSRQLMQSKGGLKENLTSLLGTTMKGGSTSFDTMSSAFTINQGIVNITELALIGKDATVNAPGMVNLPLWTIDMVAKIKLTEPADAPPLEVAFRGPLDRPAQAFGKGALDSYVNNLVGNAIEDKVNDFLLDKGILKKQQAAPLAPQQPQAVPVEEQTQAAPAEQPAGTEPPPAEQSQPAPEQQKKQEEIKPEDIFKGVLQGVLQGQ